jgi:hypothetical protein
MKKEILVSEQTLALHKDFLDDVFKAVELGHAYAIQKFEEDKEAIQRTHLFDTMRYKAALYLKALDYDLKDLPMNGLHVFHKGYDLKILKADANGNPPIAGRSNARFAFYNHGFGAVKLFEDDMASLIKEMGAEERRELLILYKVSLDGNFLGLTLVCIEAAPKQYGKPLVAWGTKVPHPAAATNANAPYQPSPVDLDNIDKQEDDADDLGIYKDGTNE